MDSMNDDEHKQSWYESFKKSDAPLSQGELIYDCPVFYPEPNALKRKIGVKIRRKRVSGIIVTQSCDLKQSKVDTVLLCPFSTLERFHEKTGLAWKKVKEEAANINKGKKPRYFLLDRYSNADGTEQEDYKIVDFQNVFTVPVEVALEVVNRRANRLRLLSPYKEKLAYAYANYFSRIGLPEDINEKELANRCGLNQNS